MAPSLAACLPVPGPVWGAYPMRPADERAPPWRGIAWRGALARCWRVADAAAALLPQASQADPAALRRRLRQQGLTPANTALALALAAAQAARHIGWTARPNQLLDDRLAEMATGEGKTLVIALAAAVHALAGAPVHVATANPYLAARDAGRMSPLFTALGLRVAAIAADADDATRRAAYGHDIVYATAKDFAFDFLRDRSEPHAPRLRGLCVALLDEADSLLLDDAEVPLILSRAAGTRDAQAARRAFLWQALSVARRLAPDSDFTVHAEDRIALLTPAGVQRLDALAAGLGGPWTRARYRHDAVQTALAALHALRRNAHYVVRDGAIELLDAVTARVAEGRVWSRGLHALVALKEGLAPPPDAETVAQITFQRFFQRYWRLAGLSGTLRDAGGELARVYGRSVVTIPLHRPCRRVALPPRCFERTADAWAAAVPRIADLQAKGRPVLVGVDGVDAADALCAALAAAGIAHARLDALHSADEAAVVAAAGRAGQVTVATRMAGRGTDIALDDAARAAGGLHVLNLQRNASRRLDRQLHGRAGRHGDPGSCEAWCLPRETASVGTRVADNLVRWQNAHSALRGRWTWLLWRWQQWREDARRAALRERLLQQDLLWARRLAFAGHGD